MINIKSSAVGLLCAQVKHLHRARPARLSLGPWHPRWRVDGRDGAILTTLGPCRLDPTPGVPDKMVRKHTVDGEFSTSSVYGLFFAANIRFPCANAIWKSKATPRCKFFMWLAVHRRCLTADNLQRGGWPNNATCELCIYKFPTEYAWELTQIL
jgi:hypothetical protein